MAQSILYHDGSRRLQDAFDSRRIADRLEAVTTRTAFTPSDAAFIERAILFFLATADAEGRPDVNHKGGPPGFVRVTGPSELAFPDYDGNGMFKSLGNVTVNPNVGLLFIDFERPRRLRVNGTATVSRDDPLMATTVGAQMIVRVTRAGDLPQLPALHPDDEGWSSRRSMRRSPAKCRSSRRGNRRRNLSMRCIRDRRRRRGSSRGVLTASALCGYLLTVSECRHRRCREADHRTRTLHAASSRRNARKRPLARLASESA